MKGNAVSASLSDIYNFLAVEEGLVTGGQPTADQLRAAAAAGIEAVVNLAPDGQDTTLAEEAELLASLGLAYHHVPVPWAQPSLAQLDRFSQVMDGLAGQPTLIHCQANFRVTAFLALHGEARLGWSRERADALIDRIWTSRPDYRMEPAWLDLLAAARARLTA